MPKKKTKKKKKAVKRKPARPAKKKIAKRKPKAKKAGKAKKKSAKALPKGIKLPAEPIGKVTHYFPKVRATAVMIERDGIRVGDTLYFKGHTTSFKQRIDSMQIEHQSVPQAGPGDEVGIQVKARTREHDLVFKL